MRSAAVNAMSPYVPRMHEEMAGRLIQSPLVGLAGVELDLSSALFISMKLGTGDTDDWQRRDRQSSACAAGASGSHGDRRQAPQCGRESTASRRGCADPARFPLAASSGCSSIKGRPLRCCSCLTLVAKTSTERLRIRCHSDQYALGPSMLSRAS